MNDSNTMSHQVYTKVFLTNQLCYFLYGGLKKLVHVQLY